MALQLAESGPAGLRSEASYLLFLYGAPPPGGFSLKTLVLLIWRQDSWRRWGQRVGIGFKSAPGSPFVRPPVCESCGWPGLGLPTQAVRSIVE